MTAYIRSVLSVLVCTGWLYGFAEAPESPFLSCTNYWANGKLEQFISYARVSERLGCRNVPDKELKTFFVWLLEADIPDDDIGNPRWQSRTPQCDWIRARDELVQRITTNRPIGQNKECLFAVAKAYKLTRDTCPDYPTASFPPTNIVERVAMTCVPATVEKKMGWPVERLTYIHDVRQVTGQYLETLRRLFVNSVKCREDLSIEEKKVLMEALVKEAGLTPGERIRYKAFIQEPKIEEEKPTVREEEPCPFSLDFTEAL